MRQSSNQSAKKFSFLLVLACIGVVPTWHYGTPWLEYHREHLVIHDCRLCSESIPIGAKYSGRIEQLLVEVGDFIEEGEVVAVMNASELSARRKKAESTIAFSSAEFNAEKAMMESELKTLQTKHECMLAKTLIAGRKKSAFDKELRIVERKLDRSRKLVKNGSISVAELEQTLREFQNLQSQVKIAGNGETVAQLDTEAVKKEIAQVHARSENLKVLKRKITIAESELDVIDELERASIVTAKSSGMITEIIRGAGSSVRVGDPIVQIQGSAIWSEAWIKESQIPHASVGSKVKITLKAYPDEELEGVISGFLPTTEDTDVLPKITDNPILMADSKIRLKIDLAPSHHALIPGFTGVAVVKKGDDIRTEYQPSIARWRFVEN